MRPIEHGLPVGILLGAGKAKAGVDAAKIGLAKTGGGHRRAAGLHHLVERGLAQARVAGAALAFPEQPRRSRRGGARGCWLPPPSTPMKSSSAIVARALPSVRPYTTGGAADCQRSDALEDEQRVNAERLKRAPLQKAHLRMAEHASPWRIPDASRATRSSATASARRRRAARSSAEKWLTRTIRPPGLHHAHRLGQHGGGIGHDRHHEHGDGGVEAARRQRSASRRPSPGGSRRCRAAVRRRASRARSSMSALRSMPAMRCSRL